MAIRKGGCPGGIVKMSAHGGVTSRPGYREIAAARDFRYNFKSGNPEYRETSARIHFLYSFKNFHPVKSAPPEMGDSEIGKSVGRHEGSFGDKGHLWGIKDFRLRERLMGTCACGRENDPRASLKYPHGAGSQRSGQSGRLDRVDSPYNFKGGKSGISGNSDRKEYDL